MSSNVNYNKKMYKVFQKVVEDNFNNHKVEKGKKILATYVVKSV